MKRSSGDDEPSSPATTVDQKMKKVKTEDEIADGETEESGFRNLDNNILFEILKHADARTLAMASCVSRQWHETARDERLWELICTRQWSNLGCGNQQLRSVVLALGGFRRLHALYIWPLQKPQTTPSPAIVPSANWKSLPAIIGSKNANTRWGKDEVNLSLSLLSIRFYEKMNNQPNKSTR